MSIEPLENLVRIRKLKQEAPDQAQIDGMIRSAKTRIEDLQVEGLSQEGKFLSASGAAHSSVQTDPVASIVVTVCLIRFPGNLIDSD